jgi:hypothetical protein
MCRNPHPDQSERLSSPETPRDGSLPMVSAVATYAASLRGSVRPRVRCLPGVSLCLCRSSSTSASRAPCANTWKVSIRRWGFTESRRLPPHQLVLCQLVRSGKHGFRAFEFSASVFHPRTNVALLFGGSDLKPERTCIVTSAGSSLNVLIRRLSRSWYPKFGPLAASQRVGRAGRHFPNFRSARSGNAAPRSLPGPPGRQCAEPAQPRESAAVLAGLVQLIWQRRLSAVRNAR